jgi:hypothetical protein
VKRRKKVEEHLRKITSMLLKTSERILDEKCKKAFGEKCNEVDHNGNHSQKLKEEILDLSKPIIHEHGMIKKIQATSVADVTKALAKGKISIAEAERLIKMVSIKHDVEIKEKFTR